MSQLDKEPNEMVPVGVGISVGPAVFDGHDGFFCLGGYFFCNRRLLFLRRNRGCAGTGAAQEPGQPQQDRQGWPQQHLWLLLPVD